MNRSYSKFRHMQESNIILEKRLLKEQSVTGNSNIGKMIDYVKKQWNLNDGDLDQNSAFISLTNKNNSTIKFNIQKGVVEYDKNFAVDPSPISINSTFDQFKQWFDSNNNYNPLSGLMK